MRQKIELWHHAGMNALAAEQRLVHTIPANGGGWEGRRTRYPKPRTGIFPDCWELTMWWTSSYPTMIEHAISLLFRIAEDLMPLYSLPGDYDHFFVFGLGCCCL